MKFLLLLFIAPQVYALTCQDYFLFSHLNPQINHWIKLDLNIKSNEKDIISTLKQEKIIKNIALNKGSTGARLITFSDKSQAIFKGKVPNKLFEHFANINSEVAAYRLDRLLEFNFVPVTTTRTIDDQNGSIQVFIQNAQTLTKNTSQEIPLIQKRKLELFDYLIFNEDRGRGNILQLTSGKIIAIDHGLSFRKTEVSYPPEALLSFLKESSGKFLITKLKKVSNHQIKNELKDLVSSEIIESILKRKSILESLVP